MRRVILKWPVPFEGETIMPEGDIVHVGEQHGVVTVWALHRDESTVTARGGRPLAPEGPAYSHLRIAATGESFNDASERHVGTVQVGAYVWHVLQEVR